MPATRIYEGHLKVPPTGAWNTAANWSAATKPVAGDTAKLVNGVTSIDTDFAAFAGVAMAKWQVGDEFVGNGGNSSNFLAMEGTLFDYNGRGLEFWVSGAFTRTVIRDTGQGTIYVKNKPAGNFGPIEIKSGRLVIVDGSVVGDIRVGRKARVKIGKNVTHGNITFHGKTPGDGLVETESSVGVAEGPGGTLITSSDESLVLTIADGRSWGLKVDHRSSGTIAAFKNLAEDCLGLVTRNSPRGFAITVYDKADGALDDIPDGDDLVTIGGGTTYFDA